MRQQSSSPLPGHFVAIVGGAAAGSEAAYRLSQRGIYCAVFEQHDLPYGKIDDGLPVWHVKLRQKEEEKIDDRLSDPRVFYVPHTHFGDDIHFYDLIHNWGFSVVLLANGAWKDRPLAVPGVDEFIGKGFEYQNPLVTWFNHRHEPRYEGRSFEIVERGEITHRLEIEPALIGNVDPFRVTIHVDQTFVPASVGGEDTRELGVRVLSAIIDPKRVQLMYHPMQQTLKEGHHL